MYIQQFQTTDAEHLSPTREQFQDVHGLKKIRQMFRQWYYEDFSYADNRLCIFLERYFSPRLVRWFAFHCYCLTMVTLFFFLSVAIWNYTGDFIDWLFKLHPAGTVGTATAAIATMQCGV